MATIADIPAEHQGYASAMPKGLLGRLEPDEAQVRLAEVARLNGQAATAGLDRDMVRYYVTLAAKVRDAMPWAEYDAEMQRLIKRRDASPATGDGIQLRQSANGQIAALKGDHPQHWEPGAEKPQDHQSARRPGRPQGTDVAGRFNTPAGGVPAGARSQNER